MKMNFAEHSKNAMNPEGTTSGNKDVDVAIGYSRNIN